MLMAGVNRYLFANTIVLKQSPSFHYSGDVFIEKNETNV